MTRLHAGVLGGLICVAQSLPSTAFEYRRSKLDIKIKGTERRGDVTVKDITFADTMGGRTAAYLVESPGKASGPGVLFVHWYEPEAKDSNRTQFLDQAVELAHDGAISVLIETMWSDPQWFEKRRPEEDYLSSMRQVVELRRALDVLWSQPRVDRSRLAYVGHDFGAMYGAVVAGVDSRLAAVALQAGTTRFSDWFLLGRKLDPEARKRVVAQFDPLDPIHFIGKAGHAKVLFQFGRNDPYVPAQAAESFFAAAPQPKEVIWYDAAHRLNEQAIRDRQAWLRRVLK